MCLEHNPRGASWGPVARAFRMLKLKLVRSPMALQLYGSYMRLYIPLGSKLG